MVMGTPSTSTDVSWGSLSATCIARPVFGAGFRCSSDVTGIQKDQYDRGIQNRYFDISRDLFSQYELIHLKKWFKTARDHVYP